MRTSCEPRARATSTQGGVVSLNGPAPNAAAKARAEEIAKSVKGVSAVNNNLQVKAM